MRLVRNVLLDSFVGLPYKVDPFYRWALIIQVVSEVGTYRG